MSPNLLIWSNDEQFIEIYVDYYSGDWEKRVRPN